MMADELSIHELGGSIREISILVDVIGADRRYRIQRRMNILHELHELCHAT
jgi:hypothetical protein